MVNMPKNIKNISQITIHLNIETEQLNEIALFHPFSRDSYFDENSKQISQRKWRYSSNVPFFRRLSVVAQRLLFKYAPTLISIERRNIEAQFKTVLAILLTQEALRDFFLSNPSIRENFFQALELAATAVGYHKFSRPLENSPLLISRELTFLPKHEKSLLDDPFELNLQMAAIGRVNRDKILFEILNRIKRPPITSTLEIFEEDETESIRITTIYAKYKITKSDPSGESALFQCIENQATSSIRTFENTAPGFKGALNQRKAFDDNSKELIGTYCGEISSKNHVLEQLLFLLDQKKGEVVFVDEHSLVEKKICFTSLYSWNELELIQNQHEAINTFDQRVMVLDNGNKAGLSLLYFNIPFNALNKYPAPGEINAAIRDINEISMIILSQEVFQKLSLSCPPLKKLSLEIQNLRKEKDEATFFQKHNKLHEELDHFQECKKELIVELQKSPKNLLTSCLLPLLTKKREDGHALKGMDHLLLLNVLLKELGYLHNKNCQNSTDRCAGADAADKAQYAFSKLLSHPFLPGSSDEIETSLFKVLYSMYLVWEEPEINAALSTGFIGEKFYNNIFQRNPETTQYLTPWLHKHPELYLALSGQRL